MTLLETATAEKRFRRIAAITTGAVLVLILVGALVRMTGSGMGCPDWPTCFGKLIPPTDVSQLPADYKTRFEVAGKEIADFDAFKTWVEYGNRLLGVTVGFLSILTVIFSLPFRKSKPWLTGWSMTGLLMVIVSGGLGAYIVKTNLQVDTISVHMYLALLSLACLLLAWLESFRDTFSENKHQISNLFMGLGVLVFLFTLSQIVIGSDIREQVDTIAKQLGEDERGEWVGALKDPYAIHQYAPFVLVALLIAWVVQIKDFFMDIPVLKYLFFAIFGLLFLENMMGMAMHYADLPKGLQPLHLLFASLLFVCELAVLKWSWMMRKGFN